MAFKCLSYNYSLGGFDEEICWFLVTRTRKYQQKVERVFVVSVIEIISVLLMFFEKVVLISLRERYKSKNYNYIWYIV